MGDYLLFIPIISINGWCWWALKGVMVTTIGNNGFNFQEFFMRTIEGKEITQRYAREAIQIVLLWYHEKIVKNGKPETNCTSVPTKWWNI